MMDIFYCIAGSIYIVGGVLFIIASIRSEWIWKKKVEEAYERGRNSPMAKFVSRLFGMDEVDE